MEFLIIANAPFLKKETLLNLAEHKKIIALDGAANILMSLDIKPDIILGDFDSISESTKLYYECAGVQVVRAPDQNFTDLQKAILHADDLSATAIHIACALGGDRLDHHESAIRSLTYFYKKDRSIILYGEYQCMQFIKGPFTIKIRGKIGDYCGVFGYPICRFRSPDEGLAWSMNSEPHSGGFYTLGCQDFDSTSNRLIKTETFVEIEGEALLILPCIKNAD